MCKILEVSKSGYYKHKNREKSEKQKTDEELADIIQELHIKLEKNLGYRQMTGFINRLKGTSYSKGYIQRLMQKLGIKSRLRRKKINRIRQKPDYTKENVLARNFKAERPNEKWLTDVTEFKIEGKDHKIYLSAILDLFDNSIVAYTIGTSNNNDLVFKMFNKAIKDNPEAKPLFHSDRGFQYTNATFKSMLEKAGMTQSMSRVGKCIDNGPMENFWGILKTEMFYGFKYETYEELIKKIKAHIYYYNNERYQEKLGWLAPLEYRKIHC